MRVSEWIQRLGVICPWSYALEWDNVGLLVGDENAEVSKVYIALDATDAVIAHAKEAGADLLLTHHPLIFGSISSVTADDLVGRRVMELIRSDMSYIATHTNYDVAVMGEIAALRMGLLDTEVLDVTTENGLGIGTVGKLNEDITLCDLAERCKQAFAIANVKVFGDAGRTMERIAISPGSGKGEVEAAIRAGADVLITGDIDHHTGIDAVASGLCIVDAGHYGIEHIYIDDMKDRLSDFGIEIFCEPLQEPFYII